MSLEEQRSRLEEERRIANAGGLARWARACASHPWRVVFGWLGATVLLIVLVAGFHGSLANEFSVPGTDFQKATDLIKAKFGAQDGAALRVVMAAPPGESLDTPERKAAVAKMVQIATDGEKSLDENPDNAGSINDPLAPDSGQLSESGRVAFFDAQFDQTGFQLPRNDVVDLEDQLRAAGESAGIQVEFTGEAESPPPETGSSEIIGLIVAFFILMVLFRALVPSLIPLLFAVVAVASAFLLLYLAARLSDFNTITPILVSMIGLGVGIDYTLFIVTRFRQMLHDGLTPPRPRLAAGATAGRAVIFAGTTVAISITGLAFIGIDFITKLGVGSALGVLTAVILANTLLPAILSLLGHKIDRGRLGMKPADESREGQARTLVAAVGPVRHAQRQVRAAGRPGRCCSSSPSRCSACASAWPTRAPRRSSRRRARRTTCCPARTASAPASPRRSRSWSTCATTRRRRPTWRRPSSRCRASPRWSRRSTTPRRRRRRHRRDHQRLLEVRTAGREDRRHRLAAARHHDPEHAGGVERAGVRVRPERGVHRHRRQASCRNSPKFLLYVIGVTFLLLAMAFRSVVVAVKAALTTLISALVGFGVLTLVVQLGHGMGVIGLDRDRPDRELRAADRVRDPVRPVDGLRGVPDEPHPRGARARGGHAATPCATASPASAG